MSTYSYKDVSAAANSAADLLNSASLDPDTVTLIDFVVNATLTLLDDPDATVEGVIEENWDRDSEDADVIRDIVNPQ